MSNSHPKPETQRLADKVYDYVMNALCTGVYQPGDYINEHSLAKKLGLSNVPVREGMERLIQLGWVERISHRGAFIKKLNLEEIKELWQMREAYELYAVEIVAQHITLVQLSQLREPIDRLHLMDESQSYKHPVESAQADVDFHQLLIEFSSNQKMAAMAKPLIYQMVTLVHGHISSSTIVRKLTELYPHTDQGVRDYVSHEQIYQAIADNDPEQAKQLLKRHLNSALQAKIFLYELVSEIKRT